MNNNSKQVVVTLITAKHSPVYALPDQHFLVSGRKITKATLKRLSDEAIDIVLKAPEDSSKRDIETRVKAGINSLLLKLGFKVVTFEEKRFSF